MSTQALKPGFIGMSVHSDAVYLREFQNAVGENPEKPALRYLLAGVDFATLSGAVHNGEIETARPIMADAITSLRDGGAEFLVVTANTHSEVFRNDLLACGLPLLDITRCTFAAAQEAGHKKLGVLGTHETIRLGLYERYAEEFGCEIIYPSEGICERVQQAITSRLQFANLTAADAQLITEATQECADAGADALVFGCTDLTLLTPNLGPLALPVLDSTVLHARSARQVAITGDGEALFSRR